MRKNIFALIFFVSVYVVSTNGTTKKDMTINILKNRNNDNQNHPINNNNPSEYRLTDIATRHAEHIRNKNRQMNLKMTQRPNSNNQPNSNFTKLAEKIRKQKVNMTAARQDGPEIVAPNMIPIFRPLLNNIRNVQPKELIKTNENTSNTNLKSDILENNEDVLDLIENVTEYDIDNSTNDVEILNLLKQQDYQQAMSEMNTTGILIGEEYFEIPYANDDEEKILGLTDILRPNNVVTQSTSLYGDRIKATDKTKGNACYCCGCPQFKIEYIPANNKLSLNQNTQNLFTLSENLKPSSDDLITIQNVITHNLGLPNNMVIESMRFVPLIEMQNKLEPKTIEQNVRPLTVNQDPCEATIERPLLEEGNAIYQTEYPKINPVSSNTRFNIPCFTATDILEDVGGYNQNNVQPIMYSNTENLGTNMACNVESGNGEEEAVAIIFKPKNISLLKVYGDILKKITLTVLVPYHVSKLIT